MSMIRKLDNTEKKIMKRKWDSNCTCKSLRPLVNKLYEKFKSDYNKAIFYSYNLLW